MQDALTSTPANPPSYSPYTSTDEYSAPAEGEPWSAAARLLFRFGVVYFAWYVCTTQMLNALLLIPGFGFRTIEAHGPLRSLTVWTAVHVLGVSNPYQGLTGSGDTTLNFAALVIGVVMAAVGAGIWSILGRHRTNEREVAKWFRVFLRFALGSTLFTYGFAKLIPLQMPAPSFSRLLETYGDLSPMGVLWSSIGSSTSYEMFTGSVEVLAGLLLVVPWTWLLGAVLAFGAMGQVFMLNMTYDVPVKLFSFHLVLMAAFLLAPELRRVLNVLVLDRTAEPSRTAPLFASDRSNRNARWVQVAFGVYLAGVQATSGWARWKSPFGGGGPVPPLYGLYDVTEMSTDGRAQPPLLTDPLRWRRAYIDRGPTFGVVLMDNRRVPVSVKIDTVQHTIGHAAADTLQRELTYQRRADGGLDLDGTVGPHRVHAVLEPVDAKKKFLLLSRGFHWVQELPFNR